MIEIPSSASVGSALAELSRRNILSAPVRNERVGEDASWIDRYLGMVDMHGIVFWLLQYVSCGIKYGIAAAAM